MKIFPFIIGRMGGASMLGLNSITSKEVVNHIDEIILLEKELDESKRKLIEVIFQAIKREPDARIHL